MAGGAIDIRFGPARLRVHAFDRPLAVSVGLAAALALIAWRNRRFRRTAGVLAGFVAVLLLAAYARSAPAIVAAGDLAAIESATLYATTGEAVLGPYSRFEWNHPGPLYFYLLAPAYLFSGAKTAGIHSGALAINAAAALGLVWMAWRNGRRPLAILLGGAVFLYALRAAPSLASAWNPHVLTLPFAAFVVAAAAFAAGRDAYAPWAAAIATFLVQTHVGLAPTVGAIGVAALVVAMRQPAGARVPDAPRRTAAALRRAAWVLLLLWALPLAEQLTHAPGNFTKLVTFFFSSSTPSSAFGPAFAAWSDAVAGVLRPDFRVAWGWVLAPGASAWPRVVAVAFLAAAVAASVVSSRRGARFEACVAGLLAVALAVSLWSVTRLEDALVDHAVFWMAGCGLVAVPVIGDVLLARIRAPDSGVVRRSAAALCAALVLGAGAIFARELRGVHAQDPAPTPDAFAASELWTALRAFTGGGADTNHYLVRIEHPTWAVAAGVLLQMQKAGIPFSVEPGWLPMFSEHARVTMGETAAMWVVTEPTARRLVQEYGYEVAARAEGKAVLVGRLPPRPQVD
jgi:hypothetical protein